MKIPSLAIGGKKELPLVPLRELVVFPRMVVPFFAGNPESIKAVEESMAGDRLIFLVGQKNDKDKPGPEDLYEAGSIAKVLQMLKLPDGSIRVLAEGRQRGVLKKFSEKNGLRRALVQTIESAGQEEQELQPFISSLKASFKRYTQLYKKVPKETLESVSRTTNPDKLVDLIGGNSNIAPEKKVELLEIQNIKERIETLSVYLEAESEVINIQNRINSRVKKKLEQNQKEYYLNEQIRQINKELGREDDDGSGAKELVENIKAKQPPQEVLDKVEKEANRLSKLQPMSPESGVLRTYLEWIQDLPWSKRSEDNRDITKAEQILDEDHYDMKKPKERVLDFLAVRQLKEKTKGPILCFVGPPGTGKTSLGRSVARAMGREFIRVSLGGVRDEAEIRGHRKTYVGALPGKIVQSLRKAGTINPVFLLDEIDKLSNDFRGDPASALLEVLDPEQNSSFMDHYLEVPYDLSHIMFITTANSVHSLPPALRDRMEIIEIPGYTDFEKEQIAEHFIIPKQLKENGLDWADIQFQRPAVLSIIRTYTMESGVRNLERQIATIIRKIAREAVKQGKGLDGGEEHREFKVVVAEKSLKKYLGPAPFERDLVYRSASPGLAHGLAWTEMGGKILPVEVSLLPGEGKMILTGSLGDVMKESAQIAMSFIRGQAERFQLDQDFQKNTDVHVHVPQGAIPKDGPSAGITLAAAILSALKDQTLRKCTAMTGEITLTGRVLAIGGVKEKVLAAYRNNIETVIMPEDNRKDTEELPKEVKAKIDFVFVENLLQALEFLFLQDSQTI
ncbi:MAG TPA: endopeptidase La [Sediminispirochaeta sp.]|nr:endopeptidase La [Sediminispirochaeta sp.]